MSEKDICIVTVFFNTDVIKKSLDFITKFSNSLEIYVTENKSVNTETEIKPYCLDLLNKGLIHKYILFDENIVGNSKDILIQDKLIDFNSEHIIITDGDLVLNNENWIDEELEILKNPRVFCVGAQMDLINIPKTMENSMYKPKSYKYDDKFNVGQTGAWFLMFRTKEFLKAYEYVKTYSKIALDSNIYKYCCKINKLWAQTIKTKAYHLTWDSYNEKDNYYKKWKLQFTFNQIWHKNKYCGYTVFTENSVKKVKNKLLKRGLYTFYRIIKRTFIQLLRTVVIIKIIGDWK